MSKESHAMGPYTREGVQVGRGLNIRDFNVDRKFCWLDGTPLTVRETWAYKRGLLTVHPPLRRKRA